MANKIAFLGLGQCGSNICEVAEKSGYKTGVINTSPEDLSALQLVKNKFLVGLEGGSAKDRRIAKNEVKTFYNDIINFVKCNFSDPEIGLIYLVFSTGGGTGSGMGPLVIDLLKRFVGDKTFGAVAILPSKSESTVAHVNSYECLKELSSLSVPTILVDNEKCSSVNKNISRKKLYDTINEAFIDDLDMILKMKRPASMYGNIDAKDIFKLLATPGVLSIGMATSFDNLPLEKQILKSLEESPYAPLELDGVVSRIGIIFEIKESTSNNINYDNLYKDLGIPLELFEGMYFKTEDELIISIIAGQSFPMSRIEGIVNSISKNKDRFSIRKSFSISDTSSISWFSEKREEATSKSKNDNTANDNTTKENDIINIDISSIFERY